ncbi:zinc finger protein 511 [Thrips palmi]|uniref:Zinc finger protein 511 n=1 Tax=Thrips palmi TaxID=161013 RepID=A0A6P9ADD7_THRPL|nr:zinc finger protein 511 [Thrips palmi]
MSGTKKMIGRRVPTDPFFSEGDSVCNVYKRLGVFDIDDEELCHKEINNLICEIPGCTTQLKSVMELELHYNSIHRYTCATCRKSFASAHLLDLHIEETHDSFFAVQAERKPMYRCLVETCTARFTTSQERHCHCVDSHAYPPRFRWVTPKVSKPNSSKKKFQRQQKKEKHDMDVNATEHSNTGMDVDEDQDPKHSQPERKPFRGFVFGRGNMKKSFNPKSSDWHRRDKATSTDSASASALEGSQLSTDLMNSLPSSEMSS